MSELYLDAVLVNVEGAVEDLRSNGAVAGEAPEFLWFKNRPIDPAADTGTSTPLAVLGVQQLVGRNEVVEECGTLGSFSGFETRVSGDVGAKAV